MVVEAVLGLFDVDHVEPGRNHSLVSWSHRAGEQGAEELEELVTDLDGVRGEDLEPSGKRFN